MLEVNYMWNETLKYLRNKQSLTQADIADKLGISQTTYGRYETGDIEPGLGSIILLADFYGVSTDYILGRTKYSISSNKSLKTLLTRIQEDLEDIKKTL
jgi:transcriptional regulator with XRE-family HTH domain